MGGLEWQIGKIGLDCTAIKNQVSEECIEVTLSTKQPS